MLIFATSNEVQKMYTVDLRARKKAVLRSHQNRPAANRKDKIMTYIVFTSHTHSGDTRKDGTFEGHTPLTAAQEFMQELLEGHVYGELHYCADDEPSHGPVHTTNSWVITNALDTAAKHANLDDAFIVIQDALIVEDGMEASFFCNGKEITDESWAALSAADRRKILIEYVTYEFTCKLHSAEHGWVPRGTPEAKAQPFMTDVEKVARSFSAVLAEWLTAEQMAAVVEANKPAFVNGNFLRTDYCTSHDYCDANMAMDEGIKRALRRETEWTDDGMLDDDTALFNAAWTMARENDYYQTGEELRDARGELGDLWGLGRPVSMTEMGKLLRLKGRDIGSTVRKWEKGTGPTGPATVIIEMLLAGSAHPDMAEVFGDE